MNDASDWQSDVLHVIPGLGTGGAESMLAALVTARRPHPLRQIVVNLMREDIFSGVIRASGVEVHDLGMAHASLMPIGVIRLAHLIRRYRPRAVQSWLYYGDLAAYWSLRLSGLRPSTRLYWGVRCTTVDLSRYRASLRRAINACTNRSAEPDAIVANSFAGRAAHLAMGYRPRAFPVIPNGIDTGRFRPDHALRAKVRSEFHISPEKPVVIHVARVDPMKDHATMIAVARALPDVQFIAVGSGTENLEAPSNVLRLGVRNDMVALFNAADIAISTSTFGEGFPNVIAEAMACGIPAAATDVGDTAAIIGQTGAVVSPGDTAALVSAIRRLAAGPKANRQERADASRHRIEQHFSLEIAVAAFDKLHLHGELPKD